MAGSIICAIDDSLHAHAAARVARDLADRLNLPLVAVHALVLPTRGLPDIPLRAVSYRAVYEAERQAAQQVVAEVLRSAGVAGALRRVVPGPTANVLIDAGDDEDAALIVVGTHGPSTLRTALTGSLAATLFRGARRPVVAVPPRAVAQSPPPVTGPVVAAVGSPADARWVPTADALARAYETPLVLAHALEEDGSQAETGRARAAIEAFDPARLALGDPTPAPEERVVHGPPGDALLRLAHEVSATLVVTGTRGHGALRAALEGSTARLLACDADRPVVVCPLTMRSTPAALLAA
jgi:nucleotide-binding universal stress UspA family protein